MNKKELYGILFKAAAETVTMLCKDKKHLGATPGLISVLHTWGQNLMEHPHIHMIVTAGGISINGNRWVHSGKKFFLPVRVLSRVFRGKFLAKLKEAYAQGDLKLLGNNLDLNSKGRFQQLLDTLYQKPWIVYAKKPFAGVGNVLRYLPSQTIACFGRRRSGQVYPSYCHLQSPIGSYRRWDGAVQMERLCTP